MSRKDYRAVAEVLHYARAQAPKFARPGVVEFVDSIARDLCQVFARDNARFDQNRFMRAVREGK